MKSVRFLYLLVALIFCIFSFGFIDPNLHLSSNISYLAVEKSLTYIVYGQRMISTGIYVTLLVALYALYSRVLFLIHHKVAIKIGIAIFLSGLLFFLAYPALSYDIFNYILTAKVAFHYHENPYIVMPIEFIGEPMLAFTRAANKLALYGPVWIAATFVPHVLATNNILFSIYAFKALSIFGYLGLICLIYKKTQNPLQVAFFALNPLVVLETFVSGHNDAFMMLLAVGGLHLLHENKMISKGIGVLLIFASILVKGATVVMLPVLMLMRKSSFNTQIKWISLLLFGVFMVSPYREEMYPWYAIWWITCLAFIPIKSRSFVHGAAYWLSFGLMMRYVPWIATREYGGNGPLIRLLCTWIPTIFFTIYFWFQTRLKKR